MERRDFISFWNEAHTIIDDAVEKRDRSVAIYISPDSGMTLNVYPWPDEESLREALERGKITYNDYCKSCKHEKLEENEPPCDECLEHPVNLNSHKPINYEDKND